MPHISLLPARTGDGLSTDEQQLIQYLVNHVLLGLDVIPELSDTQKKKLAVTEARKLLHEIQVMVPVGYLRRAVEVRYALSQCSGKGYRFLN